MATFSRFSYVKGEDVEKLVTLADNQFVKL